MLFVISVLAMSLLAAAQSNYGNSTSTPVRPQHYGVLLFRTFELLDVAGPIEALGVLSLTQAPMKLSYISDTLAPQTNDYTNQSVNHHTFGTYVVPQYTLETAPEDIDILFVPGGLGTGPPLLEPTQPYVDFIAKTYPRLKYLVSVCTGAGLLARAGVLDGRNATTNKMAWNETTALGPNVNWVRQARWVQDGNIWTTSGVSAGTDGTLGLIEYLYGKDTADGLAKFMEYVRISDPTHDPFA